MFPNPQTIVSTHRDLSKLEALNGSDDEEQLSIFRTVNFDINVNTNKPTKNNQEYNEQTPELTPDTESEPVRHSGDHEEQKQQPKRKSQKVRNRNKHKNRKRKNRKNNGYHHNNGLNNLYHYNPNYWECDSDDAVVDDSIPHIPPMTKENGIKIPSDFDSECFTKILPMPVVASPHSSLQMLIQGIEENNAKNNNLNASAGQRTPKRHANGRYFSQSQYSEFRPFFCSFHFEEYLGQEPLRLEITNPWTVALALTYAIRSYVEVFPKRSLTGICSEDYELRLYEDGEIDTDVSAFSKSSLLHQLGDSAFGCKLNTNRKPSIIQAGSIPSVTAKNGTAYLSTVEDRMFIRISIPGPQNEAHVLAIDKDSTALTVRDIYALLNKKKQSVQFHPQFFNIYYEGNTKLSQALNRTTKMIDLEQNSLMLLPRILTDNDNIQDAYQFNLVKLANEQREYFVTKIKSNTKNKKRVLVVDRHRIVKKAVDESTMFGISDHIPIDINLITNCVSKNGKFNKQFLIEYQQKGSLKSQTYEMSSIAECQQIVAKIRYLCALRKYQQ